MALSLRTLAGEIKTSLYGRRLGIDNNECLVGLRGVRTEITSATSATTGTPISNNGLTTIEKATSAAKTYTLALPYAGARKEIVSVSSSTKIASISLSGASLSCTSGSSNTLMEFTGRGQRVSLVGLSSAAWLATHMSGVSST